MGNIINVDVAAPEDERQQSIHNVGCCTSYEPRGMLWLLLISEELATIIGNMVIFDLASPENQRQLSVNRASTLLGVASCMIQGLCYGIYP